MSSSIPEKMKCILIKDGKGPAENMYMGEEKVPELREGEVLVKVKAFGLNRMDLLQREGKYPLPPAASKTIMGVEFSGTIVKLDVSGKNGSLKSSNGEDWKEGDEVFGLAYGGAYAEYIPISSRMIIHKPPTLSWEEAAGIPENWMTAFQALFLEGGMKGGENVLVHAGASGVGVAANQLAIHFGASKTFTTAGTPSKVSFLKDLTRGKVHAFNYKEQDFEEEVKKVDEGGVDLIVDFVGPNYWNQNISLLRRDGRLVLLAALSGATLPAKAALAPILFKRLNIKGSTLRSRSAEYQGELLGRFEKEALPYLGGEKEGKEMKVSIHEVYPWEKIIDAHKLMESNANSGKIVLTISDHPIGDLPVTVKQPEASESKKAESSGKDGEKSGRDAQHKHIIDIISKQLIPPMSGKLHKGQAGRVGILGGSGDYSGAPFFSSMGAMRFGADLAHVICEPNAGAVIKTYSPDLIVHGILDPEKSIEDIKKEMKGILERLHVLIVGPGLGRNDHTQNCARAAFELAKEMEIGVVVDADGLFLVANDPSVVLDWPGVPRVVLTPNIMEFKRLCDKMKIDSKADPDTLCPQLSRSLQNITILQKGSDDIISNGYPLPASLLPKGKDDEKEGKEILKNTVQGGLKRCGGQGDILSGSVGVLLAWGAEWVKGTYEDAGHPAPPPSSDLSKHLALLAAYGASTFNRTCSRRTYQDMGRSMQTEDMVPRINRVFEEVFGSEAAGKGLVE